MPEVRNMAKESFDKEIQFLRMLALTSGAYSRQQFADRLGISVHTFDKTLRRLKEVVEAGFERVPEAERRQFADALRFSYYDTTDPMLLFLFRAKSMKETESARLSLLLEALSENSHTALELLERCSARIEADASLPDEKTIRTDLKYLEQVGVIRRETGQRPHRYRLHDDLFRNLTTEELTELYDFVDIAANTQVPSVLGYLLRDGVKKRLQRRLGAEGIAEPFLYKYHYYSRILDEAHLFAFLQAIRERRKIKFLYFSLKTHKAYASKNTNPLFAREMEGKAAITLPLKVVYDHQYGRWYLLGYDGRFGYRKFRVEGMTQIEMDGEVPEEFFLERSGELDRSLQHSWLIDTGPLVTVRVRFFHPGEGIPNFVKDRVVQQGQWGTIVEEDENSFIYEIQVNGTTEIRPWIRSFGSSCEVLAPKELRDDMIAEWKGIYAYYESVRENL